MRVLNVKDLFSYCYQIIYNKLIINNQFNLLEFFATPVNFKFDSELNGLFAFSVLTIYDEDFYIIFFDIPFIWQY